MNWKKYYFLTIIAMVIIFTMINLNYEIKYKNQEVSKIIKIQNVFAETKYDMLSTQILFNNLDKNIIRIRVQSLYNGLITKMNGIEFEIVRNLELNYENLGEDKKRLDFLEHYLTDTSYLYAKEKVELIQDIKNLKIIRDSLFLFFIIFIIACLVFELIVLKNEIRYINKYLRNLLYKKYDDEFKRVSLPYMNEIVDNMNNIKTELRILDETTSLAMKGYGLKSALQDLYNNPNFRKYMKFDRIGFATVDSQYIVAEMSLSEASDLKLKRGFKIEVNNSDSLKKLIETREIRIINDLEKYYEETPSSLSTKLLLEEGFMSNLTFPICKHDEKVIGFLFFSSKSKNSYNEIDKVKISSVGKIISYIFERNMLVEDLIANSALTFVKLVEGKDPETSRHIDRMAYYAKIIAKQLSKNPKYEKLLDYYIIDEIHRYSPLHDIGKVGIPDDILLKPGKLTKEEFDQMKEHTKIGAKILNYFKNNMRKYELDFFDVAIKIAIGHHEKWDGTGYPNNLKEEQIPLEARIVALADVFDALCSKRAYKEAFSFEESVKMINELSGTHFSPDVVLAFNEAIEDIKIIYSELNE